MGIRCFRGVTVAVALAGALALSGCAPVYLDPTGGGEVVLVRTMDHPELLDITYLNDPVDGRMVLDKHTYTLLWFVPLNRPGIWSWLRESLPPGATAANVSAQVRTPWYGHLVFFPTLGLIRIERVRFEADAVMIEPRPAEAL